MPRGEAKWSPESEKKKEALVSSCLLRQFPGSNLGRSHGGGNGKKTKVVSQKSVSTATATTARLKAKTGTFDWGTVVRVVVCSSSSPRRRRRRRSWRRRRQFVFISHWLPTTASSPPTQHRQKNGPEEKKPTNSVHCSSGATHYARTHDFLSTNACRWVPITTLPISQNKAWIRLRCPNFFAWHVTSWEEGKLPLSHTSEKATISLQIVQKKLRKQIMKT